jgi:VIT1/CCC1 family predicted Fe2+/Mn2+ transporter
MKEKTTVARGLDAAGPFLRDIIFGVHDALLTNIGIITGFVAALQENHLILLAAIIDVVISAFAMAFGTYLSRTSESDYLKGQLDAKAHADLEDVMANPIVAAVVMWFTYVISGSIPLIPFMFGLLPQDAVRYATVLALIVFFIVGYLKGAITRTNRWLSGLQFLLFGSIAATVGYFIGIYGHRLLGQ